MLILGATSSIARATAAELAKRGHPLVLAARDENEVRAVAADVSLRFGVRADWLGLDALDFGSHPALVSRAWELAGGRMDGVLLALGDTGDHEAAVQDFSAARRILDVNLTACVSLLTEAAGRMQRGGWICVISSVAGERGRQSNYVYGAAKGGLTIYLQGLRNRLHPRGIRVVTVNPGFVDTRMTYGKPGTFLVADPVRVAQGIVRAVSRGQDVVYLPGFWRLVMFAIRSIPEFLFKRLKL